MRKLLLAIGLVLVAVGISEAQVSKIFDWDTNVGATSYGVEASNSKDGNGPWTPFEETKVPASVCNATRCSVTVAPLPGITKYRVVSYFGTTRVVRTDAGGYACVGLPECPLAANSAGIR